MSANALPLHHRCARVGRSGWLLAAMLLALLALKAGPAAGVELPDPTPPPGLRLSIGPLSLALSARLRVPQAMNIPATASQRAWLSVDVGDPMQERWTAGLGLARKPDGTPVPKLKLNLAVPF